MFQMYTKGSQKDSIFKTQDPIRPRIISRSTLRCGFWLKCLTKIIQDNQNVFFDFETETRSIVSLDSTFLRKKNVYARRIKRETSMPAAIR